MRPVNRTWFGSVGSLEGVGTCARALGSSVLCIGSFVLFCACDRGGEAVPQKVQTEQITPVEPPAPKEPSYVGRYISTEPARPLPSLGEPQELEVAGKTSAEAEPPLAVHVELSVSSEGQVSGQLKIGADKVELSGVFDRGSQELRASFVGVQAAGTLVAHLEHGALSGPLRGSLLKDSGARSFAWEVQLFKQS